MVNGVAQVPCYFIFGDSLSVSGNNNGLLVSVNAKSNYPPYGIDFPSNVYVGWDNIFHELMESFKT